MFQHVERVTVRDALRLYLDRLVNETVLHNQLQR